MEVWKRVDVLLLMHSRPFTAIGSDPLTCPSSDTPPFSLNVTITPPPANEFAKRAPPKPLRILYILGPSRVMSDLGKCTKSFTKSKSISRVSYPQRLSFQLGNSRYLFMNNKTINKYKSKHQKYNNNNHVRDLKKFYIGC
jgi:hypothetical protein